MKEKLNNAKDNRLDFNTYCFFTKSGQDIKELIGQIFKDYLENRKQK